MSRHELDERLLAKAENEIGAREYFLRAFPPFKHAECSAPLHFIKASYEDKEKTPPETEQPRALPFKAPFTLRRIVTLKRFSFASSFLMLT